MRTFIRPSFAFSFVGVVALSLLCSQCLAQAQQQWESLPLNPDFKLIDLDTVDSADLREARSRNRDTKRKISDSRKEVIGFLRGDSSNGANVTSFFESYVFPMMTQTDRATLSGLGDIRSDFFRDYLDDDMAAGTRADLINRILLPNLTKIAENDRLHPAVRHNAIMILGQIDIRPADRIGKQLPSPSPNAQQALRRYFSGQTPGYIKVASLAGIQRSIAIDVARGQQPTGKAEIAGELLAIAQGAGQGSDQWSDDLKYWLRRRAVQCLGLMKDPGGQGQVVGALREIVKNNDRDLVWLRLDAVQALAEINIPNAQAQGISFEIGNFLAHSLKDEGMELDESLNSLLRKNLIFSNRDLLHEQTTGNRQGRAGDNLTMGGGGSGMEGPDDGNNANRQAKPDEPVPSVEVAGYRMNIARRRAKILAFYVKQAYQTGKPLLKAATDNNEADFVKEMIVVADQALADTDIGVTDVDKEETQGDRDRSYTRQIAESLVAAAKQLNEKLPAAYKITPPEEKPAGEATQPAGAKTVEGDSANSN